MTWLFGAFSKKIVKSTKKHEKVRKSTKSKIWVFLMASRSVASVSGYIVVVLVDADVRPTTLEALCVGCDSAIRGAPWSFGEASDLSERMEPTEITEGVFERFGEMMCSSPLQETIRVAMRRRDIRGHAFRVICSN